MLKLNFNADTFKASNVPSGYQFTAFTHGFTVHNEDLSLTVVAVPVLTDQYEALIILSQSGKINEVIDRVVAPQMQLAQQVEATLAKRFQDGDWKNIRADIKPYVGTSASASQRQ